MDKICKKFNNIFTKKRTTRLITTPLLILTTFSLPLQTSASTWSAEVATGGAYNLPMPLSISQFGYSDINMTAHYDTKPFKMPPYYVIRLGKWNGNTAWEVETIHHKLYLSNTSEDVERFDITNGYNIFTVNHAWLTKQDLIWRAGGGLILAHPESTVHGQSFSETGGTLNNNGYYLAGPVIMGSLGKRFYVGKHFFVGLEGKITAAYANVKIANGSADAPDVALHGTVSVGYNT